MRENPILITHLWAEHLKGKSRAGRLPGHKARRQLKSTITHAISAVLLDNSHGQNPKTQLTDTQFSRIHQPMKALWIPSCHCVTVLNHRLPCAARTANHALQKLKASLAAPAPGLPESMLPTTYETANSVVAQAPCPREGPDRHQLHRDGPYRRQLHRTVPEVGGVPESSVKNGERPLHHV